ncbi:oxidoreductase, molybdopterin-binding subunit, partial [Streptomyces sp. SID8361]
MKEFAYARAGDAAEAAALMAERPDATYIGGGG